jgi:hypothetical protein
MVVEQLGRVTKELRVSNRPTGHDDAKGLFRAHVKPARLVILPAGCVRNDAILPFCFAGPLARAAGHRRGVEETISGISAIIKQRSSVSAAARSPRLEGPATSLPGSAHRTVLGAGLPHMWRGVPLCHGAPDGLGCLIAAGALPVRVGARLVKALDTRVGGRWRRPHRPAGGLHTQDPVAPRPRWRRKAPPAAGSSHRIEPHDNCAVR